MITETPAMRERINWLYEKHGGLLTPEQVVADAQNPSSPLHGMFEWDLKRAAMRCWIDTAREIIRAVRIEVTYESSTLKAIAYVHVGGNTPGYRNVTHLRSEKTVARETFLDECGRAADHLRRCRELAITLGLEAEVDAILEQVGAVKKVVQIQRTRVRPRALETKQKRISRR